MSIYNFIKGLFTAVVVSWFVVLTVFVSFEFPVIAILLGLVVLAYSYGDSYEGGKK